MDLFLKNGKVDQKLDQKENVKQDKEVQEASKEGKKKRWKNIIFQKSTPQKLLHFIHYPFINRYPTLNSGVLFTVCIW